MHPLPCALSAPRRVHYPLLVVCALTSPLLCALSTPHRVPSPPFDRVHYPLTQAAALAAAAPNPNHQEVVPTAAVRPMVLAALDLRLALKRIRIALVTRQAQVAMVTLARPARTTLAKGSSAVTQPAAPEEQEVVPMAAAVRPMVLAARAA